MLMSCAQKKWVYESQISGVHREWRSGSRFGFRVLVSLVRVVVSWSRSDADARRALLQGEAQAQARSWIWFRVCSLLRIGAAIFSGGRALGGWLAGSSGWCAVVCGLLWA